MTVTKPQAEMLTTLAIDARPTGARRWDAAGVMAAILKVRHLELATVGMAVLRAASDRSVDTPGVIGVLSSPCWIERPVERAMPAKVSAAERCSTTGKPIGVCMAAPRYADDDHECAPDFKMPSGSAVDELRDIMHAATTQPDADPEESNA